MAAFDELAGPVLPLLGASLQRTVADLEECEAGIRSGEDDALHQARTRVRALRSVLSVYGRAFDRDARRTLSRDLAVYGAVLGTARDAEVRVLALRELRDSTADAAVRDALHTVLASAESVANGGADLVRRELGSTGHAARAARLRAFVLDPPAGARADVVARDFACAALARAVRRVTRKADGIRPHVPLDELHSVRKAARRVRYAAEAVAGRDAADVAGRGADGFGADGVGPGGPGADASGPGGPDVSGADRLGSRVPGAERDGNGPSWSWAAASVLAEAAEQVQDTLGDHRDGILLAAELDEWADDSRQPQATCVRRLARDVQTEAEERLGALGVLLDELDTAAGRLS